ncbi:bifunctional 3-(3-hydroxy-phenyl)propionate/3-hydroxycinnamic acid hydroxylase [Streptomyces luomodiensis]|uniref:Bifunctional 3-(3-hydroxy-phenyl)propionate/3-hydroxycinnamic acid hydroxylase n=1 Tax=Streptomyces luomodiensis TaxID=3026192 RepID=A0ABY9US80_9ACTN|nr:bifunctional 3-(3-hydroxy-phenyl)propionate/3-hydroxycinnamic acid hydroxylase [Streptomyces sp. SCA4-21]WNE95405.1 bifunctional 3-(3-hydroxy-phenyl)propionate/3-hydroxycinnamic acid hydroxylase [Streptomyces sp. SCA4-21]
MTDTDEGHVDVAVIGGGTTGLALARLLAIEDLKVALIDPLRLPRHFPRATHFDDETMRTFQTMGLAHMEKDFALAGVYRFYDAGRRPVMEFPFNKGITEQAWQSDYMFYQPDFESALRGRIHMDPHTEHYFGWTATNLSTEGDTARLRLREKATGIERDLTATFVIGCDGANSFVRRTMDCAQTDYHATHRSLIVDIQPFVEKEELSGRDAFIHAGIRNPLTFVPMTGPIVRFEELLRPDDSVRTFESLDHVYEMLRPWLSPDEYRILRADVYEWDAVVAEQWRSGPLFLAGDAAHEMPPHLGQGMASGIRDAINLAWKLGRVVRGESPGELLNTYESERKPHMTEFVKLAAQMANEVEAMEYLQGTDDSAQVPVTRRETLRPRLGEGIWAHQDESAGRLSAQPVLPDGRRLDDVVGYRFAVVAEPECAARIDAATTASLKAMRAQVVVADSDDARDWLKTLNATAVVIRPDRFVFGTATDASGLNALLARLQTALNETARS